MISGTEVCIFSMYVLFAFLRPLTYRIIEAINVKTNFDDAMPGMSRSMISTANYLPTATELILRIWIAWYTCVRGTCGRACSTRLSSHTWLSAKVEGLTTRTSGHVQLRAEVILFIGAIPLFRRILAKSVFFSGT